MLLIGFASGSWGNPRPEHMAMHNYSVLGVIPSNYDRDFRLAAHEQLLALRDKHGMRPVLHAEYNFEDLPDALQQLAGGHVAGKLVLGGSRTPD